MNDLTKEQRDALAAGVDKVLMPLVRGVLVEKLSQVAAFMRDELMAPPAWDASQIKQPAWNHVQQAFIDGAREARANPGATDEDFGRASDGYTKRVFEEVDPASEAALRTGSWNTPTGGPASGPTPLDVWRDICEQAPARFAGEKFLMLSEADCVRMGAALEGARGVQEVPRD